MRVMELTVKVTGHVVTSERRFIGDDARATTRARGEKNYCALVLQKKVRVRGDVLFALDG